MSSTPSRWKQVPFAASMLVVCGLLVCGAIYLVSYRERDAYLASRNFRLLAVLAQQTEAAVKAQFHTAMAARGAADPQSRAGLDVNPGRGTIRVSTGRPTPRDVGQILAPVFTPKLEQGAYDTLALAMPDGQIAFVVGKREWELRSMNLTTLRPPRQGALESGAMSGDAAKAFSRIDVLDAAIAGVPYRMFIQPCCQFIGQGMTAGAVVVGLVASDTLRAEAMAISPTLLVIASLLVALAVLTWPFLSIALPGPRKRVTRWDALQLGFSGTVGLAIATILAVTAVQCTQLENDVEGQLTALAGELDQELTAEISSSARTLDALEAWLATCPSDPKSARHPRGYPWNYPDGYDLASVVEPGCTALGALPGTEVELDYRNFDVAALIDKEGQQVRKAVPKRDKPTVVPVGDRQYFRTALAARQALPDTAATGSCLGRPCVLQSLVWYTTGQPSAVLARPSRLGGALPVAAITLPMRSVINPVVPPGFEFAIIDKAGRVVFHSDAQRNTFEDLFLETDQNRQLRSLVLTGVDGSVRTEYWGRPYLAHVKHAQAYGWSVVTLFDRRTLRGLMLEWTMVSLLCLGTYTALWAGAVLLAFATGGAWLWPDRFRKRRYWLLSGFYVVLLVAFGLAFGSSVSRSTIALAGFMVPILACAVTVIVLKRRPAARVGVSRLDYQYDYCIAGALLMMLTGVVPGAAFVARSYDAHIEAYLKHRQLSVVQALTARPSLGAEPGRVATAKPAEAGGTTRHLTGWHGSFLYQTTLCREAGDAQPPSGGSDAARVAAVAAAQLESCTDSAAIPLPSPSAPSALLTARRLEHYLPYFSEMSVQIRELVRRRADDGSWTSDRQAQQTVLRVPRERAGRTETIRATTALPPLAIAHWVGALLPILLGLAALAYAVALFIARYVFLGAVTAPMWALGRLAIPEGKLVMLLCDPQAMAPRIHGATRLSLRAALSATDRSQALDRALEDVDGEEYTDEPILVTDLDTGAAGARELADRGQLLAALVSARIRAILAVSHQSLPELADALRSDPESDPAAIAALEKAIGAIEARGVLILDWRAHPGAAGGPLALSTTYGLRGWWRRLTARARSGSARAGVTVRPLSRPEPEGEALLRAEERVHPALRPICESIRHLDAFRENRLNRAELLEEIDERAEALYGELWSGCSDTEKLELRHIAQFGLANPGHSRAVRHLIMKRLLRKDPDLRLMNRTFRRFVVSPQSTGHVARRDVARIESELGASPWDQVRGPLVIAMMGIAAFLYFTQRDTYEVTIGAVVGLATQVPNLLKVITTVVQRDSALPAGQRNA